MIKERKKQVVEDLKGALEDVRNLYLADISVDSMLQKQAI